MKNANIVNTLHANLIALLYQQDARIKTKGFRLAVLAVSATSAERDFTDDEIDGPPNVEVEPTGPLLYDQEVGGIIPDAYLVDEENQTIFVFEVEVSHGLTGDKIKALARLFWLMDADKWQPVIVVVDKYGIGRAIMLVDLLWRAAGAQNEDYDNGGEGEYPDLGDMSYDFEQETFDLRRPGSFAAWMVRIGEIAAQRESENSENGDDWIAWAMRCDLPMFG